MNEIVSIVLPCYNSAKFISGTMKSIADQTYKQIEIIVIDDGSDDNSAEICRCLIKEYNMYGKVIVQSNRGVSFSRNRGIRESSGKYIFFLDSDDIIERTCIEELVNKIKDDKSDIAFCGFDKVDEKDNIIAKYNKRFSYIKEAETGEYVIKKMLREKVWLCIGNVMYKRELLIMNGIYFNENCFNGEDQELIYKALFHSKKVSCVTKNLFKYVQREGSFLHTYSLKKLSVLGFVMRIQKYLEQNNADDKIIYYLKFNKFQKEFIRNMNSMREYIEKDTCLNYIAKNKKINKRMKEFKPINFNIYELVFWLRLKRYLKKYDV